jgi:hypothetical protein
VRSRGPYGDCSIDGYIDSSTRLHYHCYTTNDYGNTWTWVRVVGQDIAGWVWDENLQGVRLFRPLLSSAPRPGNAKQGSPAKGTPAFILPERSDNSGPSSPRSAL